MKLEPKDINRSPKLKETVEKLAKAVIQQLKEELLKSIPARKIPDSEDDAIKQLEEFAKWGRVIDHLTEERTPIRDVILAFFFLQEDDGTPVEQLVVGGQAFAKQHPQTISVDEGELEKRVSQKTWRKITVPVRGRELSTTLLIEAVEDGSIPLAIITDCIKPQITLRLQPRSLEPRAKKGEVKQALEHAGETG